MGVVAEEDQKRRNIDLALHAARERLSSQTHFVHEQDAIPVLENFYYALALFRSKTAENIQEGKALIARLLPFAVGGNFPVYLHEYPRCIDNELSSEVLPPLFYLLKDFSSVLGEELLTSLKDIQNKIVHYLQAKSPISNAAKSRLLAFLGEFALDSWEPEGPSALAQWCICAQMMGLSIDKVAKQWDPQRACFVGEAAIRYQEGMESAVTILDLYMGQYYQKWSHRALEPSVVHMRAAIIQQMEDKSIEAFKSPYTLIIEKEKRQCLTLYFGDSSCTHSLVVEAKKGKWESISEEEGLVTLVYEPEETFPAEEESQECAIYVDAHPSLSLQVLGAKATTYRANEEVTIDSSFCKIGIAFRGEAGEWIGHILKGNRSYQKKTEGYSAYDWKLGWRTLRREPKAKVYIRLFIDPKV